VSNVIDFLERFGQDAALRDAGEDAVAEALRTAGLEPALQAAILDKDQRKLEALLGADTNVCCMINAPDEEEEEEEEGEEEEEEEPEEEKSRLDSAVASRCKDRVA
jgi:hypothetical protein